MYRIDIVLQKEKQRYQELIKEYEQRLSEYPRGSLLVRESGGRQYCYFRYREGQKVITKYAGTIKMHDELSAMVEKREGLIAEIKSLNAEIERIEKMEAIK